MRVLAIDIETSPCLGYIWDLWNQNISLSQLRESSDLLCFACKWLGQDDMMFWSQWQHGKNRMVREAHKLLDEADAVLHYNGESFDIPYLNKEFLLAGLKPPAPYQQIDLYKAVKKRFRFPSNKLEYVSETLGFEGKTSHEGFGLWVKVMGGDEEAQAKMEEYNKQDVVLLEQLHEKLLPWISGYPNVSLRSVYTTPSCIRCGSRNIVQRAQAYTAVSKFNMSQCLKCGGWQRAVKRSGGSEVRSVAW